MRIIGQVAGHEIYLEIEDAKLANFSFLSYVKI